MGWDYTNKSEDQTIEEFLRGRIEHTDSEGFEHKVLAISFEGQGEDECAYIALSVKGGVIALVVMLDTTGEKGMNIGYKIIDENFGPLQFGAAERVLHLLTEDHNLNDYAREWRKECWANVQRRKDMGIPG